MAKIPKFDVTIKINFKISLWDAIKLRIAGKEVKHIFIKGNCNDNK